MVKPRKHHPVKIRNHIETARREDAAGPPPAEDDLARRWGRHPPSRKTSQPAFYKSHAVPSNERTSGDQFEKLF